MATRGSGLLLDAGVLLVTRPVDHTGLLVSDAGTTVQLGTLVDLSNYSGSARDRLIEEITSIHTER